MLYCSSRSNSPIRSLAVAAPRSERTSLITRSIAIPACAPYCVTADSIRCLASSIFMAYYSFGHDGQMFDRFFKIAVFLEDLVAQPIAAEKSFWILGDHLSKCVDIHRAKLPSDGAPIALRQPDRPERSWAGGRSSLRGRYGRGRKH